MADKSVKKIRREGTHCATKQSKIADKAAPRRPGRPSASANRDQRARLLDAAIALYGERGIEASPLRSIAQRAGVTPALLHYYFTSKNSLIETILAERIAPFLADSAAPLLAPLASPRATLRNFLETHMRNIAANPWMPRLLVREVLSEGGKLRTQMQAQFMALISPKVLDLIITAQRRGEIRADFNPMLLGLSLISLAVFPFAAMPIWSGVAQTMLQAMPQLKNPGVQLSFKTQAAQMQGFADIAQPDSFKFNDTLIAHTLAVIDSVLEVPRAKKSKR